MKRESVSITTLTSGVNNTRLLLEGQLTIRNAHAIKRELLLALNSSQNLELVFRNMIKIDLAVLQLLIALQKSAARLEKTLSFDIELTDCIQSVMQNSGLEKLLATNFKSQVDGIH
jgi:anti-anti-sigma regulatory factor